MKFKGPFRNPVHNDWMNIAIYGVIIVGALSFAVRVGDEQPYWWLMFAAAIVLEGLVIYSLIKRRRDAE